MDLLRVAGAAERLSTAFWHHPSSAAGRQEPRWRKTAQFSETPGNLAVRAVKWPHPRKEPTAMKSRRLGRTGLKVSEICLGTMTFGHQCDEPTSFAILDRAADAGVDFIDTADVYPVPPSPDTAGATEEIVGKWIEGQRDRYILATKCRMRVGHAVNDEGLSRRHVLAACEASLRRLRTDYIDLYQTHSPDPETPQDETLRALDDLVRQGKVR